MISASNTKDDGITIVGDPTSPYPSIICFHGSGDSCASWATLTRLLSIKYRVLLWDRQNDIRNLDSAIQQLRRHLKHSKLSPPYVLIAHSYGGTFARSFLQKRADDVAGMVLVETGQETGIGDAIENKQYEEQVMGDNPVAVIRGNTLIDKWRQYEEAVLAAGDNTASSGLSIQKQLLDATDKEDERLKKAQLALSRQHRYIHIPDCGHNVVQDRPQDVAREVDWIMENLRPRGESSMARRIMPAWLKRL
ncbi:hypothetical protein FZEAL_5160 [Fusarium zealandicum]|uniref:AB hydrolase-1 domain-containing protein n=1 Tax=Fusarium zealandicum TaxID=1053134 RepID=A0A8H4XKW2_9HYPO|nr:hypothetical protein FZEAL_5160 [Fusarium zealandicum]